MPRPKVAAAVKAHKKGDKDDGRRVSTRRSQVQTQHNKFELAQYEKYHTASLFDLADDSSDEMPKGAAAAVVAIDNKKDKLGKNRGGGGGGGASLNLKQAKQLLYDASIVSNKLQEWVDNVTGGELSDLSESTDISDDFCTEQCEKMGITKIYNAMNKKLSTTYLWKQKEVYIFYNFQEIQFFVAGLIFMNFAVSAVQYTMLARESEGGPAETFFSFEVFFGYAFLIELVINMYGSWFWSFYKSGWNIFDFLIVAISIVALYVDNLPGIAVLRLFRAFRVIRLFKRVKELNKIFTSILRSVPPIISATGMLCLVMGIWSILGVDQFGDHNEYYFGNFLKGLLTLTQVMTMDSWSSGIARDIIYEPTGTGQLIPVIYFISYLFIASIIMANVLVAILLEKFVDDNDPPPLTILIDDRVEFQYEGEATVGRVKRIRPKKDEDYLDRDIDLDDIPVNDFLLGVDLEELQGETLNPPKRITVDGLEAVVVGEDYPGLFGRIDTGANDDEKIYTSAEEMVDLERRFRWYDEKPREYYAELNTPVGTTPAGGYGAGVEMTPNTRGKQRASAIHAAAALGLFPGPRKESGAAGGDNGDLDFAAIERNLNTVVDEDKSTESTGAKLDSILDILGVLNTRVKKLEQRLDEQRSVMFRPRDDKSDV